MHGTDYAQTRIAAIEGMTARVAQLAVNNSQSLAFPALEEKLAELKREAKVWLLSAPPSEWNAKLAEVSE